MRAHLAQRIRTFISENLWFREDMALVANDASLLESGLIDSTGILELVAFLESEFNVAVLDEEIIPENFDSIASSAAYIERKLGVSTAAA